MFSLGLNTLFLILSTLTSYGSQHWLLLTLTKVEISPGVRINTSIWKAIWQCGHLVKNNSKFSLAVQDLTIHGHLTRTIVPGIKFPPPKQISNPKSLANYPNPLMTLLHQWCILPGGIILQHAGSSTGKTTDASSPPEACIALSGTMKSLQ